jgi:hypothetical protein
MLFNIANGSMVLAMFSGVCAIGVSDAMARITRPIAFTSLAVALVLYAVSYFS